MSKLPQGWAEATIEDVTEYVQRGKSPKYASHSDLPVINQKCVRWTGVDEAHLKYVDASQWASWTAERFLVDGDILWNSTGTGTIGRAAIFRPLVTAPRAVADSHVTIVRTNPATLPEYLHRLIQSPLVQSKLDEMQSGSTNQVELSKSEVLETLVPLPPLPEQRRIVAKIDSITGKSRRARDHLDHIPRLVEKYKQAVLAAAFNSVEMAEWRRVQLENVLTDALIGLVRGKSDQSTIHGVPYIRMNHYDLDGRWNDDDLTLVNADAAEMARYELHDGDLLFNTRNSFELVGKVALWSGRPSGCLYNNNLLRLRFRSEVIPAFAFYQMISPQFRAYLHSQKSATTSVCAIYQRSIMAAPWAYPDADRQLEVANWIEGAFSKIDRLASEATSARRLIDRLDQAVLAKAFRGELVPQDPEDEPASVLLDRIRTERDTAPKTRRGRRPAA
ncbi:restriction endonuclease subunit S [Shinella sumterensis]|uniref:Restriction endonuclease subunit S n=1 Tax=Shinella sumterensis TaxID=1967501 RepID=A0AA50CLB5_9HYPH|nr:restriction endonuclease subunit S [Shinella sumterensis]WLR96579.1 restriction endonuclease subunit S [Shinella sumterensis]